MTSECLRSVALQDLEPAHRLVAARLVIQAIPGFYALFGDDGRRLEEAVAGHLGVAGTELGHGRVWFDEGVAGLFCALPTRRLRTAQILGLRQLTKSLGLNGSTIRDRVARFSLEVAPAPEAGWYLARIAVRQDLRGRGLAERIMGSFLKDAPAGEPANLHVHRDNWRAIRFYEKCGFTADLVGTHQYRVMTRPRHGSATG